MKYLFFLISAFSISAAYADKICETKDQKGAVHCEKNRFLPGKSCKFFIADEKHPDGLAMKHPTFEGQDLDIKEKDLDLICKYINKQEVVDAEVKSCIVGLSINGKCGLLTGFSNPGNRREDTEVHAMDDEN